MNAFIICDLPVQSGKRPDTETGQHVQSTWSWRNRRWEDRNESIIWGRRYRGVSGYNRAKRIAARLESAHGFKTHVAIDRQWAVY